MKRFVLLAALALSAAPAWAQPGIRADVSFPVPRITLDGGWTGSRYTVWRTDAPGAPALRIGADQALCTGDCYVNDPHALPGGTYWYRFDLVLPDGSLRSYGPAAVTIGTPVAPGLSVALAPNPSRGPVRVTLGASAAGPVLEGTRTVGGTGEAAVYDVNGRRVRELFRGPLDRLRWERAWDGRDASGRPVEAGLYFVRFTGGGASRTARLVISR